MATPIAKVHAAMVYMDCPVCDEGMTVPYGGGNEGAYTHTTDSTLWAPGRTITCTECGARLRMPKQVGW